MESLPPRTQPPKIPTQRRHSPPRLNRKYGYREYKPCLRWDFGFICAFCLLHESDICPQGTNGLPVFSAEHLDPQSTDEDKANDYGNVVYACSFCNTARRNKLRVTTAGKLLDPTTDAWADHFQIEENYLVPKAHDADAIYTHAAYDLDDERKVARREDRYRTLFRSLEVLEKGSAFLKKVSEGEIQKMDQDLIEIIQMIRMSIRDAIEKIEPYSAIPYDAPTQCRCKTTDMHCLPEEFAKQTMQISPPSSS